MKKIFLTALLIFSGCSAYNVYSPTNPQNIDEIYDSDTLIAMGDEYFENGDYENAFKAYSRAESLSPTKSRAIEGKVTSYIFMRISITNIYNAIQNNDPSKFGNLNTLYDVSRYVWLNLYKIINKETDNKIRYDDVNVNLNYYFFGYFFSIFDFIDFNSNNNIVNDTNDLISINEKMEIDSNNSSVLNEINELTGENPNPFKVIGVVNNTKKITIKYENRKKNISRADQSLLYVTNNLHSEETRNLIVSFSSFFNGVISEMDKIITNLTLPDTNININLLSLTNIYEITNNISLTNIEITNDDMIINYLSDAGYNTNDYDSFTNDLNNAGITNVNDLTNLVPSMTNISEVISNYFNL
ncbi:MAG: hypothetical protein ACP5QT_09200 [Brevinematia bacterium]